LLRSPLANTNAEGEVEMDGDLVHRDAIREMEVVWPSGAVLRKAASNHHEGRWLKTVVLSVVGKGAARPRQVWTGKMSDEREFSVVDVSKLSQMTSEPRPEVSLGISLGDSRLLPRWCPAYRQHEPGPGSRVERVKACPDTVGDHEIVGERESFKRLNPRGVEYRCGDAGGLARSSCDPPAYRSGLGSEGVGPFGLVNVVNRKGGTA
jgi:hypothetical protein